MASGYQIFLRDEQVVGPNASNKRSMSDIHAILREIIPSELAILRITTAGDGYFISHANDLDLNYIFKAEFISKSKDKHLKIELSHRIQDLRKIVIPDIPNRIFDRSIVDLIEEIKEKNALNILTLTKFHSEETNKNYFYITLESINARNLAIIKGKINISDNHLSVHKTFSKSKNTQSGNQLPQQSYSTSSAQNRGFALASSSRWGGPHQQYNTNIQSPGWPSHRQGSQSPQQSFQTPPIQSLASSSRWGGPNQQTPRPQTNTSVPSPGYPSHNQGPPTHQQSFQTPPTKYNSHQEHSASDLIFNALVINNICEKLSSGIEYPETYLALQNKALSQRGLPSFVLTKSDLIDSKNLYYANKNINNSLTQSPTSPSPILAPKNPPSTNLPIIPSQPILQPQLAELTNSQPEDLPSTPTPSLSPQSYKPPTTTNLQPSSKPHTDKAPTTHWAHNLKKTYTPVLPTRISTTTTCSFWRPT